MIGQESFESEKETSIGSRDSNEGDSDDSGSPRGGSSSGDAEGGSNSPVLSGTNGNITPILVSALCIKKSLYLTIPTSLQMHSICKMLLTHYYSLQRDAKKWL